MCWILIYVLLYRGQVSVAGCLGYDVLESKDLYSVKATEFQLLVV